MAGTTDAQHDMLLLALGGELFTSCLLPQKATVLDVGTGTGTWACQVAAQHPDSRVYGIDLQQVDPSDMPHNVVFETVDVMTGFPFNTGTFDFVHSRLLIGGITDWKSYLENLFRITKKGGFVECSELELRPCYRSTVDHSLIDTWTEQMVGILSANGLTPDVANKLKANMETTGFTDVKETVVEIPVGTWESDDKGQEIGRLAQDFSKIHMIQWAAAAMHKQGAKKTEVDETARQVSAQLFDTTTKAYLRWHFVTGRKGES